MTRKEKGAILEHGHSCASLRTQRGPSSESFCAVYLAGVQKCSRCLQTADNGEGLTLKIFDRIYITLIIIDVSCTCALGYGVSYRGFTEFLCDRGWWCMDRLTVL